MTINKLIIRAILRFAVTILVSYFLGFIVVYNILIRSRSISQVNWQLDLLTISLLSGTLGIIWRFKKVKNGF